MRRLRQALAALLSAAAFAAQPAAALDFGFEPGARFGTTLPMVMTMRGEILEGDLARLKRFVDANRERWLEHGGAVVPVIDGGDVEEAIALGAFLRDALSEVLVPDAGSSRCTSACFFLLAQAVERRAMPGTTGVHRPYFDPAALAAASPDGARLRYSRLLADLRGRLLEWAVPQALAERMFATPSAGMYWLSAADLGQLGIHAPWFAEFAAARCGLDAQAAVNLAELRLLGDEAGASVLERSQQQAATCVSGLRRQARARLVAGSPGD